MKVKVLFFGLAHDVTGFEQEEAEIPEGQNVASLCRQYQSRFPRLAEISSSLLVSVNQDIAGPSSTLRDGDEVAFLPPVSGGSTEDCYRITRDSVSSQELIRQFKAPEDGAVVLFEGVVRNHSGGRRTLYLEYEAYETMAIRMMREIGESAKRKFPIDRIAMVHRLGRVDIGDPSVAIVVTSEHRRAAFEACHYAIDELKRKVPIWKKEYFEDGAVWAEGEAQKPSFAGALG
jgi:molybdopterin converting factor subunit 1